MDIKNVKVIGGIGVILPFLGFVPYLGFIFLIGGSVLQIIAFYQLGNLVNKDIFKKWIIGYLISISSIIFALIIGILFGGLSFFLKRDNLSYGLSFGVFVGIAITFLLFWIGTIIASNFYKKSYILVGEYFNLDLFKMAGDFLFWGAISSIILVGFILMFVSNILLACGFFSLPSTLEKKNA